MSRRKPNVPEAVHSKKLKFDVVGKKAAMSRSVPQINQYTGMVYTPRYFELLKNRKQLPIWEYKEMFMDLLSKHQTIVLVGETGSGKTTQIPQWCVDYSRAVGKRSVSCTQPRRVAAMSVAQRVSEEMDVSLGQEVGYSIRFEDCSCSKTILKYMTDGMLLREGMSDPMMEAYQIILLDEAHERTLATDILIGVLKEVIKKRNDLKLVIMSATLDADKFQQYFDNGLLMKSKVVYVQGREHQVLVNYLKTPTEDYVHSVTKAICQLHQELPINEHMLAFLTGQEEIESMAHNLRLLISSNSLFSNLEIRTLYASLSYEVQMEALEPPADGTRRCILSTNVAETSLTIPGVRIVIDSGKVKTRFHVQGTGMDRLQVVPISQAQAWQRSGRAGRVDTGKCYRLYTAHEFEKMDLFPVPEIQRSNMAGVVLHLAKIGIKSPLSFDWIDGPDKDTLVAAIRELKLLGAIEKTVEPLELTDDGKMMAIIPLDPPLAKVFLTARKFDVVEPVLTILSILSSESVFQSSGGKKSTLKKRFCTPEGDLISNLKIFREYRKTATKHSWCKLNGFSARALQYAAKVRLHLKQLCNREGISLTSSLSGPIVFENIRKCFFESLPLNVAFHVQGNRYMVKHPGKPAVTTKIHPHSTLFNSRLPVVMFTEIIQISSESHLMCNVSLVDPEWVKKLGNMVNRPNNFSKHKS